MSDPRVSGTERYIYRGGLQSLPEMDAATFVWDSVPLVLETEGGTWKGIGVGIDYIHGKGYTFGHGTYEGQGAYAWLTYTLTFFREATLSQVDDPYLVSGWIEPTTMTP
jgi:hypothetical protein